MPRPAARDIHHSRSSTRPGAGWVAVKEPVDAPVFHGPRTDARVGPGMKPPQITPMKTTKISLLTLLGAAALLSLATAGCRKGMTDSNSSNSGAYGSGSNSTNSNSTTTGTNTSSTTGTSTTPSPNAPSDTTGTTGTTGK